MTLSLRSSVGFSPTRYNQTSFSLPDNYAFFFSRVIFTKRGFFSCPPRHCKASPSLQLKPRTSVYCLYLCSSKCLLPNFPLSENTKTLEAGQTLQGPLAHCSALNQVQIPYWTSLPVTMPRCRLLILARCSQRAVIFDECLLWCRCLQRRPTVSSSATMREMPLINFVRKQHS